MPQLEEERYPNRQTVTIPQQNTPTPPNPPRHHNRQPPPPPDNNHPNQPPTKQQQPPPPRPTALVSPARASAIPARLGVMCRNTPIYPTDYRCVCDFAFSFCWSAGVLVGFLFVGVCFYAGLLGVWVCWGVLCVVLVVFGWGQPLGSLRHLRCGLPCIRLFLFDAPLIRLFSPSYLG